MRKLQVILILILSAVFFGCSGERWDGYVYPDKGNLLIHSKAGQFDSLEECKSSCMTVLESKNALQKGFYKCGKNCKSDSAYYNTSCEETFRFNFYH